MNQNIYLKENTIYVIDGDYVDVSQCASQTLNHRLALYQPSMTSQPVLPTHALKGCPVLTTRLGLKVLRDNQRFDKGLDGYHVKIFKSTVSGQGALFCGDLEPY